MSERVVPKSALRRFALRGGAASTVLGLALALPTAAVVMRGALVDAAERHRSDLAELLASSCQAAVALDDPDLALETINDLAPRLRELRSAIVRDASGRVVARWQHARGLSHDDLAIDRPIFGANEHSRIGSVSLKVDSATMRAAVGRMWTYLGAIALVSLIASVIASVLIGREMADKSRLEGELNVAERLQTALLPRSPTLSGVDLAALMRPALEVGGDYYDVVPCDDGGFVCVGDVAGKGLPAGLVMLMMQSGLATLLRQPDMSPARAVGELNRMVFDNVHERLGDPRYATLVVARLFRDGRVVFAGGHLDLILLRADAGEAELVEAPGPFVGLEADVDPSAIEESMLTLRQDDLLLLYTDGITESARPDGEMFGTARLRRAVVEARTRGLEGLTQHIMARVREFTDKQRDDMTVLALRYRGVQAGLETVGNQGGSTG